MRPAVGEGLQPCLSHHLLVQVWKLLWLQPGLLPVGVGLLGVGHGVLGHLRPQMLRCQHLWEYEVPLPHRPGDTLQRQEAWPSWERRLQ